MEEVIIEGFVGASTNVPITPNANAVINPLGDANDTTIISFQYNNITTYWSPQVSSAFTSAENPVDVGNAVVTFMAGLTVNYRSQSAGYYTVTVDGPIKDSGTVYKLVGLTLGLFPKKTS